MPFIHGLQKSGDALHTPIDWGITRDQVMTLLVSLRKDPQWNSENTMYTLVKDFIVPWTAGYGVGYALHINAEAPKRVNVMVSHSFAENAEEFLEDVLRATTKGDTMYICAFSNYQAEDGAGPSLDEQLGDQLTSSPFFQVISDLAKTCKERRRRCWRWFLILLPAVVAFAGASLAYLLRSWCSSSVAYSLALCSLLLGFLLHLCLQQSSYRSSCRMVVVPTRNQDIYHRLWCVFEIFVAVEQGLRVVMAPSMARAGDTQVANAICSKLEDQEKIHRAIAAVPKGYNMVNQAIQKVIRNSRLHAVIHLLEYACLLTIPCAAQDCAAQDPTWLTASLGLCWNCVWVLVCYGTVSRCQGVFHVSSTILLAIAGVCLMQQVVYVLGSVFGLYNMGGIGESAYRVLIMATSDVHAAALIYTLGCCSPGIPFFRTVSLTPAAMVSLVSVAYSCTCGRLIWDLHLLNPLNFFSTCGCSLALFLTWRGAIHWGLRINKGSSQLRTETALAWAALSIVMCWYLWVPDFICLPIGVPDWNLD